jgi:HlyD family secretion protein
LAGRLQRIALEVGDEVQAGESELARLEPTAPHLLDPRDAALAKARVKAAEGRLRKAESELVRVQNELDLARKEQDRVQKLFERNAGTASDRDRAIASVNSWTEMERSARFAVEIAQFEVEQEQAALVHTTQLNEAESTSAENPQADFEFRIVSPITGRVLKLIEKSSAVLQAGAPLLEVGDPTDLEIVVDVLSSDAVRIQPGQQVELDRWGGAQPLQGKVRLVEPSGFLKVSALGVEEQRVNVVVDLLGGPQARVGLGDNFRVEARIITWSAPEVLSVPTGALFRRGDQWAVFVEEHGVARERVITLGERNTRQAQVLEGLKAGEQVLLHPSDQIQAGVNIEPRLGASAD